MAGLTYTDLLNASAAATQQREEAQRALRGLTPHTVEGSIAYAELLACEAREGELRAAVRKHPDHTYDGL